MLLAILATTLLAIYSSNDDFMEIVANKKIRHGAQWLFRAAVVTLVCYLLKCLLFAIPLGFLFSAVFRYKLNKKRGLDWRYISPSSWYDWQFIRLTYAGCDGERDDAIEWHGRRYAELHIYGRDIHRAGTMAYIFEAVVFIFGSILYLLYA